MCCVTGFWCKESHDDEWATRVRVAWWVQSMYAAAGGASLASRQARRNVKKQHSAPDVVHQQFQKRFNQLQAQHAPASADHYLQRQHEQQLLARLPDNCRHFELKEPFPLRHHDEPHLLRTAPVGLHSRLPSYVDLNGRITGFGSSDISEVGSSGGMTA